VAPKKRMVFAMQTDTATTGRATADARREPLGPADTSTKMRSRPEVYPPRAKLGQLRRTQDSSCAFHGREQIKIRIGRVSGHYEHGLIWRDCKLTQLSSRAHTSIHRSDPLHPSWRRVSETAKTAPILRRRIHESNCNCIHLSHHRYHLICKPNH
jgi:hypothetical protein